MVERVGIGEFRIRSGSGVLAAYGLGSCVGLFLYDDSARTGGLAHIMLSGTAPERTLGSKSKYAENAISAMLEQMTAVGAGLERIGAVLVGGAHMFSDVFGDAHLSIGQRNVEGVRSILQMHSIRIVEEDVGGDYGRTIEAEMETGKVKVKSFKHGVNEILWKR